MSTSKLITRTCPSQFINIGWFILTIGCSVIHPVFGSFFFLLLIRGVLDVIFWDYEFYDDRVVERRGILNVTEETVNYFRIKSIKLERPWWMRIFGLSIVSIITSEQFKTYMMFYGVEEGDIYVNFLRDKTKHNRKKNGISDIDIFYT